MDNDTRLLFYEQGRESYDDAIRTWCQAVLGVDVPLDSQLAKFQEEALEVATATTPEELVLELGDTIAVAIALLHLHGTSMAEVLPQVVDKNYRQYPPDQIEALVEQGMTNIEAVRYLKSQRYIDAGQPQQLPLPISS